MTAEGGWRRLVDGYPWFEGAGRYPIPAYSEFMPAPRVGVNLYGEVDAALFDAADPHGWRVSEIEDAHQIRPGFGNIADQVMSHLLKFAANPASVSIAGMHARNLTDNPYWSPDLAARATELARRPLLLLLALSLSKTQDDRGRVRWTLFGASEQGPEKAFWNSFYTAPGQELPQRESRAAISRLLFDAFGVATRDSEELHKAGLRVLPSGPYESRPHWRADPLPRWTRRFLVSEEDSLTGARYVLTFKPFGALPESIRRAYLDGAIELLPSPLSLLFWGMPLYLRAQEQHPLAIQYSILRLIARHEGVGIRIPQSGLLHLPRSDGTHVDIGSEGTLDTYARTHRWDRVPRDEDASVRSRRVDTVATTLFSTALSDLGLYHKPMARNCQIWTRDGDLILNGPTATRAQIRDAAARVLDGGAFLYRFEFPPMRVGRHEVFWQRPLAACWSPESGRTRLLEAALPGYFAAYECGQLDLATPIELYPRLLNREAYLDALHRIDAKHDHYESQTTLNVLNVLDTAQRWGSGKLPRAFARQMMRVARDKERFSDWLDMVRGRCTSADAATRLTTEISNCVAHKDQRWPAPITYDVTATRAYEKAYWNDLVTLSHGHFVNKANADVVRDEPTLNRAKGLQRDLLALGEYLIDRHRHAIDDAGMQGKAYVGELPFEWNTDFEYREFGGWASNQDGSECERNILVVIPGNNRGEAVVMGDHYDTAYMEDIYETARGGDGARVSAEGADDNASATATLLLAAPIFLKLAREGKLERDVWLIHLTGEEFPSDCMGARAFCQSLVEKTLRLHLGEDRWIDLSRTKVVGALVMDMIAHNRDHAHNVFQISPGRSDSSLKLAYEAHVANMIWNHKAEQLNRSRERRGRGHGVRSDDAMTIPDVARHPVLDGEVRTAENPQSSVFNTDVQIFSDIGAPCILMMENYDINRTGYHDTLDTLKNIDLDYGAALSAICIETIARVATA
jgi:hypothetical protein